ncbi:hypothetical protein ANN_08239 [Periplaneta americana]|uniref:Uncharacterized protein n=1 Tax=Periplaneta americana TaxID=6978 RepID=A0ABQ8T218_PERAM|nr:hypothetical protein ANN_08239 [Periplaneta americana]
MRAGSSPHGERNFGQCMGPVPTQHRDALEELRQVAKIRFRKPAITGGGIIVLTTRYLHTGWMIVHLYFGMWNINFAFYRSEKSINSLLAFETTAFKER